MRAYACDDAGAELIPLAKIAIPVADAVSMEKVTAIMSAIAAGARLPPVRLLSRRDDYVADDGLHRIEASCRLHCSRVRTCSGGSCP